MAAPDTALWRSKKKVEGLKLVKMDLKAMEIGEDWYNVAQDRGKWRSTWSQHLAEHQAAQQRGWLRGEKNVLCDVCGRRFMQVRK